MYIDHIAIYTNNLERLKDFYITYFSGTANDRYHNERTGMETYFISFEGGCRLEIMTRPEVFSSDKKPFQAGLTHFSFCAGSREKVDELTNRLTSEGHQLKSAPRVTGDGYYESCVFDPDGNEVEIVA